MNNKTDYEKETRFAYMNLSRARAYKQQYTKSLSWARFTMWRERLCVEKALKQCNLKKNDNILDIPCGTGVLANVFNRLPFGITASDISWEMMQLAREENWGEHFNGFVQADITRTPFKKGTFACVITIGLLHRIPEEIKILTLKELSSLSKKFVIVSCSIDSPVQRLKQWLIQKIRTGHRKAPSPISLTDIIEVFRSHGLLVKRLFHVVYFLSSEVVFLLVKAT